MSRTRASRPAPPAPPRAVTFDCWSTLIFEPEPGRAYARRVAVLAEAAHSHGVAADPDEARAALDAAWKRHLELWNRGVASGAPEMAGWALEALGVREPAAAEPLVGPFAEAALTSEVQALEGAGATLERLARAGVRRALVCDTGFSPGRVVRRLLAGAGLLDLLEVLVFSDEVGVPKPHLRPFQAALEPLRVEAHEALHVGDLRRTDVAGARAAGMGSVRLRGHHDDRSELPDADFVVDSHAELLALLGWDDPLASG